MDFPRQVRLARFQVTSGATRVTKALFQVASGATGVGNALLESHYGRKAERRQTFHRCLKPSGKEASSQLDGVTQNPASNRKKRTALPGAG
jgi:hypothetical protein